MAHVDRARRVAATRGRVDSQVAAARTAATASAPRRTPKENAVRVLRAESATSTRRKGADGQVVVNTSGRCRGSQSASGGGAGASIGGVGRRAGASALQLPGLFVPFLWACSISTPASGHSQQRKGRWWWFGLGSWCTRWVVIRGGEQLTSCPAGQWGFFASPARLRARAWPGCALCARAAPLSVAQKRGWVVRLSELNQS